MSPGSQPGLAIVLKGYPRLSETFIANELKALEDRGHRFVIVSLRRPTDSARHPVHDRIRAPVLYLPEYLHEEPVRVMRAVLAVRRRPGFAAAWAAFRADLARDRTRNRVRRFGQACVLAAEMPPGLRHLHAHFMHTPGSVARYAALIRGRTMSLSAHARDIWTTPEWDLRAKLRAARFVSVCSQAAFDRLREVDAAAPLHLIYHGLPLADWTPPATRSGSAGIDAPVHIVSVGRLVPKKGTGDLLDALARLLSGPAWHFTHIGGGPEKQAMRDRAERLGLSGRITWRGAAPQAEVKDLLARADLFALAARADAEGDRDGLPNVLLEAQAMGLPVVATDFSAIPELVRHGETGWLVPPGEPGALADALARLIRDPAARAAMGAAGRARVARDFAADPGYDRIADLLAGCLGPNPSAGGASDADRLPEPHEAA